MSQDTNYGHPPITEAVIGVTFREALGRSLVADATARLARDYSSQHDEVGVEIKLEMPKGQAPQTSYEVEKGFRLASTDLTEILVLRPNNLTVSQLAPYPGWDTFFARFARDWKSWKATAGFREIGRVGLRYINRIDIPATEPIVDHEKFLNVFAEVPEEFGPLDAYAMKTKSRITELGASLVLNSAVVPSPILNMMSIQLDLDISVETGPPQSDTDLFEFLAQARIKKNQYFEWCITPTARRLFR